MSNGKIVVMGGDGFIGAEICRLAVETRHQVISISRRGKSPSRAAWADAVDWVKADIFDPNDWRAYLRDADAVIDCIGIIVENPRAGLTYERMNGESAIIAARAAAEMNVGAFVFISAAPEANKVMPRGYLAAKQRAEDFIQATSKHWAVLRPTFVYGWARPWSMAPGRLAHFASHLPVLRSRAQMLSPLPVNVVASAALRMAIEPNLGGIFDVPTIERLGRSGLRDWQAKPVAKVA